MNHRGKPQIVVHAECKLRLVFAKLGDIEMIYIIMTVEDTRREVRIPDSNEGATRILAPQ